ncbi:MAG: hypothetical protein K0R29_1143 [Pseudobdellovibrio sp.]|jgi:hypothetical protein|nr:hypothetical protein [Pseudobdellovibrio sp.]
MGIMRIKAEQIISEVENLKTVERNSYLNGSEASKLIWADLEKHLKHLRTVMKAGDFDGIGEREIPVIIDKIKIKKSDWMALVTIEKAREVNAAATAAEIVNSKYKAAKDVESKRSALRNPPEVKSPLYELGKWFDLNRSGIESFCATTFIVVLIQLALNVYLFNQVRITTQYSIIDPLEQQLSVTESKNIQMAKRLSNMKKEITLYRTLMKNMPLGSPKRQTSKVEFDSLESLGLVAPDNKDLVSLTTADSNWAD